MVFLLMLTLNRGGPVVWLSEIDAKKAGVERVVHDHESECCGFGGTFAAKLPEVSVAMMTSKLDDVALAGARVLVSSDSSCLAHIESGARGIGGSGGT